MSTISKYYIRLIFVAALFVSSCSNQTPEPEPANTPDIETPASPSTETPGETTTPPINTTDPYTYLNNLRTSAGMISLSKNDFLEQSAASHAQYLISNGTVTHNQVPENTEFSGVTPGDRAIAAGYNTYSIGEGIATASTELTALDDLFSAIYHRFTLLNFEFNEIGMALASANNTNSFVHNMANSRLNSLCQTSESVIIGRFYTGICKRNIQLNANNYESENAFNVNLNPSYVLWPPVNGTDIPPVFFEETPDPLPDYSVSGYPVSIQFNELKTGNIIVSDFRLFNLSTQQYISNTRLLDKTTDPVANFSSFEFSLFPLERLQWATRYRAEVEYSEDSVNKRLNWEFTTRNLDGVIKQLSVSDDSVNIPSGVTTFLYFTPQHGTDLITRFSTRFPLGTEVNIDFIDQNTLKVIVNGNQGDTINLSLNGKREFSIFISTSQPG